MHPQHAIEPTRQAADYSGRDANGIAALRSLVADMAVAFPERLVRRDTRKPVRRVCGPCPAGGSGGMAAGRG